MLILFGVKMEVICLVCLLIWSLFACFYLIVRYENLKQDVGGILIYCLSFFFLVKGEGGGELCVPRGLFICLVLVCLCLITCEVWKAIKGYWRNFICFYLSLFVWGQVWDHFCPPGCLFACLVLVCLCLFIQERWRAEKGEKFAYLVYFLFGVKLGVIFVSWGVCLLVFSMFVYLRNMESWKMILKEFAYLVYFLFGVKIVMIF